VVRKLDEKTLEFAQLPILSELRSGRVAASSPWRRACPRGRS
jgi:hypothetical protein